ncbi:MAG: hypothetical protein JST68_07370 [Bacteroidetes bacterium]|nr:hypothetical protein [Bacteroidota bacterium]
MSIIFINRSSWRRWKKIFITSYILLSIASLYNWLDWMSAAFIIGSLALLYTPSFDEHPTGSFYFGSLTLLSSIAFLFLPDKAVLYLVLTSAILQFRETFYRRVSPATPIILLLMTPVANDIVQTFGIAICHLLIVSLLTTLLLINYFQRRYRRRLHPLWLLLLLLLTIILNIGANTFRFFFLVHFYILPQDPTYNLLNLIAFAACLPILLLTRLFVLRSGVPIPPPRNTPAPPRNRLLLIGNWLAGLSLLIIVCIALTREALHLPPKLGILVKILPY